MNESLFIEGAYSFYRFLKKTYDKKRKIFERLGFDLVGSVSSKDWEVLAAILMRDRAKPGNGCDLMKHEVKSAKIHNSFEYQYHRHSGLEKLEGDKFADHIYISYGDHYDNIEVRRLTSQQLSETFHGWAARIVEAYNQENPKQRCRQSVSYGYVKEHGELIMSIKDGQLISSVEEYNPSNTRPADYCDP